MFLQLNQNKILDKTAISKIFEGLGRKPRDGMTTINELIEEFEEIIVEESNLIKMNLL